MSKGLKQMVADATKQAAPALPPVDISGDALRELTRVVRTWTGWKDGIVKAVDPRTMGFSSRWAGCDHNTHEVVVNVDLLLRNPNRMLNNVTPFRLRQEAFMTGALLHEAGHARHSHWMPKTEAEADVKPLRHSIRFDYEVPTEQCVALARLMEEPRIEGIMARDEKQVGAHTLGWTMRASAAHTAPMTALSTDPNQQIMDLITSWAMRAGRQYALEQRLTGYRLRNWVQNFTSLLSAAIVDHLNARVEAGALGCDPVVDARRIIDALIDMTIEDDDTGPKMIDRARDVLVLLFPETPGETQDDQPMPGAGCASSADPEPSDEGGEGGKSDEAGEKGEGNTEPEDEGEGDDPGAGDAGEDDTDPEDGDGDGDPDEGDDGDDEGEGGASPSTDPSEGEPEDGDGDTDTDSPLAQALAAIEAQADSEEGSASTEAGEEAEEQAVKTAGTGAGSGAAGSWRSPTPAEREVQRGAERFMRDLIDSSESSTVTLSDSPSATVDAAALSAWRAGGQRNAPNFFVRTRREVEPSPPVKIAILVDVSYSMNELQKPSALLSWALSAAALDLRNFAGRGTQVESCLIHWGYKARVIQGVGETLEGIKVHRCDEGTMAMGEACALVEEQMPGFFDISPTPTNRLLVQFTDWELGGTYSTQPWISRALESGVNMLTVAPAKYNVRNSSLPQILAECPVQRGSNTLIKYDRRNPEQVWQQAATALS